ncbi:hypothetical protein AAG570_002463 [Ranatra chinensis]|uniref:Uncharacterized protein n=1 Tax=Ranatra chinensis TaxID=642074 RepID=A0ABD0Y7M1_9HEMI
MAKFVKGICKMYGDGFGGAICKRAWRRHCRRSVLIQEVRAHRGSTGDQVHRHNHFWEADQQHLQRDPPEQGVGSQKDRKLYIPLSVVSCSLFCFGVWTPSSADTIEECFRLRKWADLAQYGDIQLSENFPTIWLKVEFLFSGSGTSEEEVDWVNERTPHYPWERETYEMRTIPEDASNKGNETLEPPFDTTRSTPEDSALPLRHLVYTKNYIIEFKDKKEQNNNKYFAEGGILKLMLFVPSNPRTEGNGGWGSVAKLCSAWNLRTRSAVWLGALVMMEHPGAMWWGMVVACLLSAVAPKANCDDSLRGALEAIQRRQRDLSPSVYYPRPYLIGDGQPEDIGYGYQKSVAPNTVGVFDPVALSASELGSHDFEERPDSRALEKLLLDYIEEGEINDAAREYAHRYQPGSKRSIFRERDDTDLPDALQRLYESDLGKPAEDTPIFIPSSFRERFTDMRRPRLKAAHSLVKNFGRLGRNFEDKFGDEADENDEYLSVLNSIWEKYKGEEDPEDITESDVEELLEYLNSKDEKKRQYGDSYSSGYDFFNSPIPWTKRFPEDITRAVVGGVPPEYRGHRKKNSLQDVAFDDRYPYRSLPKRYPITKRSPSNYSPSPTHGLRGKKNSEPIKQDNDLKVSEQLNNIFSTDQKPTNVTVNANETSVTKKPELKNVTGNKIGQKEISGNSISNKPLDVKKKSIDWSEYFGIDRRKKSRGNDLNDEWLLNQYLRAYGLKNKKGSEEADNTMEQNAYEKPKKRPDDMDSKLRAMEDLIVDQAIKYTGAHEGTTDSKEVQEVKDRVMAQLAAAYSLEKMRRALGEFKSSIAAQKATAPASHSIPSPKIDNKDLKSKRIAVKKEKVDMHSAGKPAKKDATQEINSILKHGMDNEILNEETECPVLREIQARCSQVGALSGDRGELLLPLCTLHQVCYLCGAEGMEGNGETPRSCDAGFLSEAHSVCRGDAACYYSARRALAALRSITSSSPAQPSCDWRTHPCLAQFLSAKR